MARYRNFGIGIIVVMVFLAGILVGNRLALGTPPKTKKAYFYMMVRLESGSREEIEKNLTFYGLRGYRFVPVVGIGSLIFESEVEVPDKAKPDS